MNGLLLDLRCAYHSYTATKKLALMVMATLSLGIAAITVVFSLANAILIRPLFYKHADQLLVISREIPPGQEIGSEELPWSRSEFLNMQQSTKTLRSVAAFRSAFFNLTGYGDPLRLEGTIVSDDFFNIFDIHPLLGRTFNFEDSRTTNRDEVILSYSTWKNVFHGQEHILGRSINLNGFFYTIVGVMPEIFTFPRGAEMPAIFHSPRENQLWILFPRDSFRRGEADLAIIARSQNGQTADRVKTDLALFSARQDFLHPEARGWFNVRIKLLETQITGNVREPLFLLFSASCGTLFIVCSNAAGLLLARSLKRRKDFALQVALGATKLRIIRQLLLESAILSSCAGGIGVFVAANIIHIIRRIAPPEFPRVAELSLDWRVLAFSIIVVLLVSVICAIAPAIELSNPKLNKRIKEGKQKAGGSSSLRNVLSVVEIAIAVVLVISTSLLLKSFYKRTAENKDLTYKQTFAGQVFLPNRSYPDQSHMILFYQKLLDAMQSNPKVASVGVASSIPFSGAPEGTVFTIPGESVENPGKMPSANYSVVSPSYFSTIDAPILAGRDFAWSDNATSRRVAIINSTMSRKFWPKKNPLEKQIKILGVGTVLTIVGVTKDVKHVNMREAAIPEIYVPFTQNPWVSLQTMQIIVRTTHPSGIELNEMQSAVKSVDASIPISQFHTILQLKEDSDKLRRLLLYVVSSFGIASVLLASIGLYSVVAYSFGQRTREIGIRMALGAQRKDIIWLVLRQGIILAAIGVFLGDGISLGTERLLQHHLSLIESMDFATLFFVSGILLFISLLATFIPARTASLVLPYIALHQE